ncbi:MAG: glycosyltransferase family 4 protein [Mobilicoccus sp.]|nr:glycosyltransferase family 4 protein [Mobilicoccus sp.]
MTSPSESAVAYLVSRYPALSHTFIEREILGLRAEGVRVETFSVRATPPGSWVSRVMKEEGARTRPLIGAGRATWIRAHLDLVRRAPDQWLAGIGRALRTGHRSPKARLWQVFYFLEAVVLYHDMRRAGLRHVHAHFANVAADVARHTAALGRAVDGPDAGWRWSFTMHGPTGFESVASTDLANKARDADGVSCITDFCRSQMMWLVEPKHWPKMQVVRMTVDGQSYRPPEAPRGHDDGRLRLLDVGRLVAEKGAPVLVDAVQELRSRGVEVDLKLVGAGPLHESLQADIAARGLEDSITLTGPIGQDELPEMYAWADVFVLPSFQEGLPVVLMEALSSGVPAVTTQIAGVSELIRDGQEGRLVPAGRADLLADALEQLAADPELRARMGRAGREAVLAEFTPTTAAPAARRFVETVQGRAIEAS